MPLGCPITRVQSCVTAYESDGVPTEGVTASAAELNVLDGVTAGTTKASSGLVVGADKDLDVLALVSLRLGSGAGTAVTATAAEINAMCDESGSYASKLLAVAAQNDVTAYTSDGAIATSGVALLSKTSAGAYTLAAPTPGSRIWVQCGTDFAHVLTAAANVFFVAYGQSGTADGATHHVATFAHVLTSQVEHLECVYESATKWRVLQSPGVTFST
jgi:hypothetical protein